MKVIIIAKIILGVIIILGALRNISGVFDLPNANQAIGYLAVTFLFLGLGSYLLYSGIQQSKKSPKQ